MNGRARSPPGAARPPPSGVPAWTQVRRTSRPDDAGGNNQRVHVGFGKRLLEEPGPAVVFKLIISAPWSIACRTAGLAACSVTRSGTASPQLRLP